MVIARLIVVMAMLKGSMSGSLAVDAFWFSKMIKFLMEYGHEALPCLHKG